MSNPITRIKELTDRVDKILAEEERCWYELENPRCRMRRPEFQLKVRLDVIQSIKSYQIKELVEVLKEVSIHYSDVGHLVSTTIHVTYTDRCQAIDQIVELKKEATDLKTKIEADTDIDTEPDSDNDTHVKSDDDADIDMDKSNVEVAAQSVAGDIETMFIIG